MRNLSYIKGLLDDALAECTPYAVKGRVLQVVGTIIKAYVPTARLGEICLLRTPGDRTELSAEVVGFSTQAALLTPLGDMTGISSVTEVIPTGRPLLMPVGRGLLGRVLDGLGRPIDGKTPNPIAAEATYPVEAAPPDPMRRKPIDAPQVLGVRALDGLMTCGLGQRLGIFAAAGGGKSTLLGMLAKNADVDVSVLALIGERGREVREFIEKELGEEHMARSVVVVATSDRPAMERVKASYVATAVAEFFRDQGMRVLLMMDSVTRFARALREIGLAAGEPPTRRGFPPSVFSTLPKLMERAGRSERGSITGLYTVLMEGDDENEPVADETRSILDGHIILSRKLAAANHYPAIDVLRSLSRSMPSVTDPDHRRAAARIRELLGSYEEIELLVRIGEYKRGVDPTADEALAKMQRINAFLCQGKEECVTFEETVAALREIAGV